MEMLQQSTSTAKSSEILLFLSNSTVLIFLLVFYDDAEGENNDGAGGGAGTVGGCEGRKRWSAAHSNSVPRPTVLLLAIHCLFYNKDKALFM